MKVTGALLRETLEREVLLSDRISRAHQNETQIIDDAEHKAASIIMAAQNFCTQYKENAARATAAETDSLSAEWSRKNSAAIAALNEKFNTESDRLAEEIAERIVHHGA
ncbi:MAG TPA: hypothetical protein VF857_09040 [Spirochaetota bacterium]